MLNKAIDSNFIQLRTMIADMGYLTESMFRDCVNSLMEQDVDLAKAVIEKDREVDRYDLQIDEYCLKLLALYGPKAAELRYIVTALRLIIDLERIGDHCKAIARQAVKQRAAALIANLDGFTAITQATLEMMKTAMEAFFEKDSIKAEQAYQNDATIDSIKRKLNKQLIGLINEDPTQAKTAVALINIIRRVERIADHTKNISECVPYIVDGTIMRHRDLLEDEEG